MYASQASWRRLYEALLDYRGDCTFEDVLEPWLRDDNDERRFLSSYATRPGDPWPSADPEQLCHLYAISRVNDVLLLRFQPGGGWAGPPLVMADYASFVERLGFRQVETSERFDPFFHELVGVERVDSDGPVRIVTEHWPALMLGDLLFSRAGCSVRSHPRELDARRATSSTLFWSHRRRDRPAEDLSMGWGSNSQWRTRFRRDYRVGGMHHFNVDGEIDAADADTGPTPNPAREELTSAERIELVTHRCFVRTDRPDNDLWPWDDRYSTGG